MKTLYLIRHAKSSWAFDLNDHDRPLGKRGRKDVIRMGLHLSENQPKPEILLSSTASRAFYTALHICDQWQIDEGSIRLQKELFHAGSEEILKTIQSVNARFDRIAVFAHNPGITSAVNALSNQHFDNIPTCGIVGIHFDIDKWIKVRFGEGTLAFSYFPKEL